MIAWPVVVRFDHDDELLFVGDANEWGLDPEQFLHSYDDNDTVIDSEGKIFTLSSDGAGKNANIRDTGENMSLDEFAEMIKCHVSALGECCAAKFNIDSFRQGMLIVAGTNKRQES